MRIGVDTSLLSGNITGIGRYVSSMLEALSRHGADLYLYSSRPWCGAMHALPGLDRVARNLFLQSIVPFRASRDAIDVFWGGAHRLPMILPKRIAQVVTIHDLVWRYAPHTMKPLSSIADKIMIGKAIRSADRVLVVSENTGRDVSIQYRSAATRVRLVKPGIARLPKPQDLSELRSIGIDRPYVLFVGTLEPRKNLERLLEAYGHLPMSVRQQYPLVVVGGKGWGHVDVHHFVRSFNLEGLVHVTGFVSDEQLSTLYAHARLVAMPSLYEGFGLPLIEAMSYGVPVLTSNISSLPEVAGDAGVLIDPFNVSSIAAGLVRVLTDDTLHEILSASALSRSKLFSWDKAAQGALAVFQEAVNERRTR